MPLENLTTIHTVDWEISSKQLKKEFVSEVAENYAVWGNTVPEPTFAITNININASQIQGYGENNGFIRFVYNGIPFIKKYCAHDDFNNMTQNHRNVIGVNKKELSLNIIGQFILNSFEDKIYPEVKILYFDSEEVKKDVTVNNNLDIFEEEIPKTNKANKKSKVDDEDFDW